MAASSKQIRSLLDKLDQLPPERIAEVEDFVDFLKQRVHASQPVPRKSLDFPIISVGKWPESLSLRREDMYGNDGR